MEIPFILCVSIIATGILLIITFYQSIQIHCMKVELRKCLKAVKEEKAKERVRKAIFNTETF